MLVIFPPSKFVWNVFMSSCEEKASVRNLLNSRIVYSYQYSLKGWLEEMSSKPIFAAERSK